MFNAKLLQIQHTNAIAETTKAETTTIEEKLSEKTTVLEEIELDLFTGFEDIAVVGCTLEIMTTTWIK